MRSSPAALKMRVWCFVKNPMEQQICVPDFFMCAIGAILHTVAAANIRQKLDTDTVALFGAKRIGFFNQFTERFVRSVQNQQTFRFGKIRFFIVIHRANIERS